MLASKSFFILFQQLPITKFRAIHDVGLLGEDAALRFLLNNNYSVWCRNYSTRHGEIDLVAARDNTLLFIEVKTRASHLGRDFLAQTVIDDTKVKHIEDAGAHYLREFSGLLLTRRIKRIRYDIIAISYTTNRFSLPKITSLKHIPGAF